MSGIHADYRISVVVVLAFVMLSLSAGASQYNDQAITIHLAGASSVASYSSDREPLTGWGQNLQSFFTDEVRVKNHAASGRSTKSFIEEGRLDAILDEIKPDDYLMIQFAHNDQKSEDPTRYTEPYTSYKAYLREFVNGARGKGAHPIFVTPVHRRRFNPNGTLQLTHGEYPTAMKELAEELSVPVVDLHKRSQELFELLGESGSKKIFLWLEAGEHKNYPSGIQDNTHFNTFGADQIARLVAEELIDIQHPLKQYISQKELPELALVLVDIPAFKRGSKVAGVVPLDIISINPDGIGGLERITVSLGDKVIFSGSELPDPGELSINSRELNDGRYNLAVRTEHEKTGSFVQEWSFVVENEWKKIINMSPPLVGFFGHIDFLDVAERSNGWGYETDDAEQFFNDRHRLVRTGNEKEYLIWDTPNLKYAQITAFVLPQYALTGALELSISDGKRSEWHPVEYEVEITINEDNANAWQRVIISVDIDEDFEPKYFRLTLTNDLPKWAIQIGHLIMEGYNDKQEEDENCRRIELSHDSPEFGKSDCR